MSAVEIKTLSKRFKTKPVLDDINLTLDGGKIYGLIGNNGVGKTTLIRCILGLLRPTQGQVSVFGENAYVMRNTVKRKIAVAYDTPLFVSGMNAFDNLYYFCSPYHIQKSVIKEKYQEYASRFKLNISTQRVGEYSMGMKQKLNMIRGLIIEPELFVLDEPFNGLDPTSKIVLCQILKEYHDQSGCCLLISSHELGNLQEVADDYIFLKDGKVAAFGELDKVTKNDSLGKQYRVIIESESLESAVKTLRGSDKIEIITQEKNMLMVQLAGTVHGSLFQILSEMKIPVEEIQRARQGLEVLFVEGERENEK